jgi:hypothetical protein
MQRRDFVKAMMAASVTATAAVAQQKGTPVAPAVPSPAPTAIGPLPWMRGLLEVKPLPMASEVPDAVADSKVHFFNPAQTATLRRLCEVLMPPYKSYPGAIDAGTPEFLDFLIGVSPVERQQMYGAGLDRLEHETKQRFATSFAAVTAAQADQVLRPWLKTWMSDHPPTEPFAYFVNTVHSDIRTATINSQAWSEADSAAGKKTPDVGLYWYPIDPDLRREQAVAMECSSRHGRLA